VWSHCGTAVFHDFLCGFVHKNQICAFRNVGFMPTLARFSAQNTAAPALEKCSMEMEMKLFSFDT